MLFPFLGAAAVICFGWPGTLVFLVYPLQVSRRMARLTGSIRTRFQLAFFEILARVPESLGQMKFLRNRLMHVRGSIIEYK
jgi:hypothetical protein